MDVFYPYPTLAQAVQLTASSQRVDGMVPPVDLLAAKRSIDLSGLEPGWRRASISMRADVPTEQLRELGAGDVSVTLSVNCPASNTRFGLPLKQGPGQGSFVGVLELESTSLARRAELRAIVTGTLDGRDHRYLGSSEPWTVWVSSPEIPLLSGDLEVRWVTFSGDDRPPTIDPVFRHEASFVDITQDPPVLLLNSDLDDLRRLFDDVPHRSRVERALREAHFLAIASPAWMAMFNASVGAITTDGDQVEWPAVEWQKNILESLLPRIFPELSLTDALKAAYEDDASSTGARVLQSRANAAIAAVLRATAKARKAVTALEEA